MEDTTRQTAPMCAPSYGLYETSLPFGLPPITKAIHRLSDRRLAGMPRNVPVNNYLTLQEPEDHAERLGDSILSPL